MHKIGILGHEIAQFKMIIYDLPGCVYWKDKNGHYLGCNKNFLDMAGLHSIDELIGKTDQELCWASQTENLLAHDKEAMTKGPLSFEETVILANGEKLIFTVVKSPLHDEEGEPIGVIGTSLDISQQKKFINELKIAKEKAEVANQLKTEFIENMQHDMRTPIAGLCSMLEMLMQNSNYEEISQLLPIATKSAKELLALCNEMINFENIEYGKRPVILRKMNLFEIASHVINLNSSAAKYKDLQLLLEIDTEIPDIIYGDTYRVKKILTNLIGNSIKFTKEGKIKLAIHQVNADKDEISIQFEISDTGIGIAENKKEIIFEKFTRLTPSNQGIYKGSGLGLSYVKKFVSELNGKIELVSQLEVGTTFYVTLPFKIHMPSQVHDQTKQTTTSSSLPMKNNPASSTLLSIKDQHYHILLIEDDFLSRIAAKSALEKTGCQVTLAEDVSTAKKLLDTIKFSLVVSDIGLPDGTGFEIINTVKSNKSSLNYSTPFVALTAHSGDNKKLEAKENGFLSVLQKPLTIPLARDLINSYLLGINENSINTLNPNDTLKIKRKLNY